MTNTDNQKLPETEEQSEEQERSDAEAALKRAYEYHSTLDSVKTWAIDAAAELREMASETDDPDEVFRVAEYVESVFWRIELGDRQRGRQPRIKQ
jgi:hypothetical protein